MKLKIYLIMICCVLLLLLTGCGKQEVNYNIDAEIDKIINMGLFPEELLDKEVQEDLKDNASERDLSIINIDSIGYNDADNKLPVDGLFGQSSKFYDYDKIDWLGEKWSMSSYRNQYTTTVTGVRFLLGFDKNDMEYAHRRIKELTTEVLKKYNNVIYQSNVYEYDLLKTELSPIEFVFSTDEAYISYKIMMYYINDTETVPAIQIFFLDKEKVHDMSKIDLKIEVEYLKEIIATEKIKLSTVTTHPVLGIIISEEKDESEYSPEEELLSGGVFYD